MPCKWHPWFPKVFWSLQHVQTCLGCPTTADNGHGATEVRSLPPVKLPPVAMMNWPGVPCVLSRFSHVSLFLTLWTVIHQAPLSMGFSRQEYWSGLPCPPPGDLPNPGIKPESLHLLHCRQILYTLSHPGSPGTIIPWFSHGHTIWGNIELKSIISITWCQDFWKTQCTNMHGEFLQASSVAQQ